MDKALKKKNWKALASMLCWIFGKLALMANTALKHVPSAILIILFILILGFGLLCAISAIRTGHTASKIVGGVAFLLLLDLASEIFLPEISIT